MSKSVAISGPASDGGGILGATGSRSGRGGRGGRNGPWRRLPVAAVALVFYLLSVVVTAEASEGKSKCQFIKLSVSSHLHLHNRTSRDRYSVTAIRYEIPREIT